MGKISAILGGLLSLATLLPAFALAQSDEPRLVQARLTEPGSTPFYLNAFITERGDPDEHASVEISWVAPNKWKRTIQSAEFSQTQIVNGDKIFEQDSADYFPLGLQTLAAAMVDPKPLHRLARSGDRILTKANGGADESGKMCFGPSGKMCITNSYGLKETVGVPGHTVDFTDYQKFKGKRVARMLFYHIDAGDSLQARVMTLGELTKFDEESFSIVEPTLKEKMLRSVVATEAEIRELAVSPTEIIWPQVLENRNTKGNTSYYISIDRSGRVREVLPLSVAIERADDSARRQIMKWKFKPLMRDGASVQVEGALNFHYDTRAYGPAAPLTDSAARALASAVVEPAFPVGIAPSGSTFTISIAVDVEGNIIESIAGEGPRQLYEPCSQAIGRWRFGPVVEDGKPRPYRAQIVCRVP